MTGLPCALHHGSRSVPDHPCAVPDKSQGIRHVEIPMRRIVEQGPFARVLAVQDVPTKALDLVPSGKPFRSLRIRGLQIRPYGFTRGGRIVQGKINQHILSAVIRSRIISGRFRIFLLKRHIYTFILEYIRQDMDRIAQIEIAFRQVLMFTPERKHTQAPRIVICNPSPCLVSHA